MESTQESLKNPTAVKFIFNDKNRVINGFVTEGIPENSCPLTVQTYELVRTWITQCKQKGLEMTQAQMYADELIQKIEATRNTLTVGFGGKTAGLTVRDNQLRTVQCQLTLPVVDYLMEQLPHIREHLLAHAEKSQ